MSHRRERFTKFRICGHARPLWSQAKATTRSCEWAFAGTLKFSWRSDTPTIQCARQSLSATLPLVDAASKGQLLPSPSTLLPKRPRFDPAKLFVHFASAATLEVISDAERAWSEAKKLERIASQHLVTKTQQSRDLEMHHAEMAALVSLRLQEREQKLSTLETRQMSLHDEEGKAMLCEEVVIFGQRACEEAEEALRLAEVNQKKAKLKARKRQSSIKKKKKTMELVADADKALKLATLELGKAQSQLEKAKEALRVQRQDVQRCNRHQNLAREKLDKAIHDHVAAEKEERSAHHHAVEAGRFRAAAELALEQAKKISAERKAFVEGLERDATFANWPGDPVAQQFPAPFRDYEVNQEMDTFELDVGSDNIVDLFFEAFCGEVWAKEEKVTVAACIGNAFGWVPIGGPCWQQVREKQDELVSQRMAEGKGDRTASYIRSTVQLGELS